MVAAARTMRTTMSAASCCGKPQVLISLRRTYAPPDGLAPAVAQFLVQSVPHAFLHKGSVFRIM